ncbi:putative ribonuclease H-like domain-containing protein [Tanacetum coccineum]
MAGSDDDIPPPPPPQIQTPTQQTPHTVSTIKLPIFKKGEYDIWAIKMEHYLAHTDYPIWEVIQRGNGPVSVSTDTNGVIKVLPPKTAEEILAREREKKARTTLLMALPEDHLAKFHKMTDAKEMWEAIKSRFGGNDESKKMQKYILKQQFEGFSISNSEGLHKGYDKFQSLLIFESDVKGSTASSSSNQNVAFISENTSSTNEKVKIWTSHSEDEQENYALMAYSSSGSDTKREQLGDASIEIQAYTQALKKVEAQLVAHQQNNLWYEEKIQPSLLGDCNFHEKRMAKQSEVKKKECKGPGQRENRPVWNNVNRVNHQKQFVPTAILTRIGKIQVNIARASSTNNVNNVRASSTKNVSTARHNFNSQAVPTNAARKVNIVKPIVNNDYPQRALKNKGIVDSGCSRHMTGNKASVSGKNFHSAGILMMLWGKGIKREYSNARTPQQNGVAERKNMTLIEATRTILADSFLPNTFWAKAVSTACYVLNRVLVTKPQNKTPYELITGKLPIISYIRSFGCHVTILNTIDHLGKFDEKSDEGFLVGYSLQSKAFRVYNLETKRVEENLHITFLENKPNVAGKGLTWLYDLDYLTNSMNYQPVKSENQDNKHAGLKEANHNVGTEDNIDAGDSEIEDESAQDYFVLPIWSSYTSTIKNSKAKNAGEEPHKNPDLKTDEKTVDKEDQDLLLQAGAAKAGSTNRVNTASTSVSTASPYGGLSFTDLTNTDQDDSKIPALEEIYDNPTAGIFTNASYDDEGAVADFTNLESIVNASPIPTSRIDSIHPSTLIHGDPKSAVQTRSNVTKSFGAHAFVSYIQKQRRNNHKDFQHCLFACFLSQNEPKKISEALKDESWVHAMQEELLQFKIQKVWILVDLPYGKKAIGTKWVYRNKKDERGVVVRNKERLVAQGHRQEEGIDYNEVFALVARIEAIRIFLPFASFMGFIVYQMDVKSAFLYGKINEEDKYVVEILKKFDFVSVKTASILIESQKPLVKDEEASDVDVHLYRSMIGSLMYLTASRPDIMFAVCACSRVSSFDLEAYSDSDYAGANLDRKSKIGGCQFLGRRLISWQCKKQTIVATSTTETEYVAAANYCGQVLWIQNQMLDYGFNFMNTKIYIDNESTICIVKNPVYHSKTKHIAIRHHFTRDAYEKKLIQVLKIHIDNNVADLLTKAFNLSRFQFLVVTIGMINP